jgi:hypothetical protein
MVALDWAGHEVIVKHTLLLLVLLGCGSAVAPPDSGRPDSGGSDGGAQADAFVAPTDSGIPGCPSPSDYVGDSSWTGQLVASDMFLCVYPRMIQTALDAHAQKQRVRIIDGSYPYPLAATDAPFRLPMCLEPRGTETPPAILAGTVRAVTREDIDEAGPHYHVSARFALQGSSDDLRLELSTPVDSPRIDLSGVLSNYFLSQASICTTEGCYDNADRQLLPCRLRTNMCDSLMFTGGSVTVDQFHWAGNAGAGFAAGMRVTGELDGTSFDISDYDQITVEYGVHAFTRGLLVFFDAPIAGACGLSIERIEEGTTSEVQLVDCAGTPMSTRTITGQNHLWGMPCP